jgi:hypothetical protein
MAVLICKRCWHLEEAPDAYIGRACVCPRCRDLAKVVESQSDHSVGIELLWSRRSDTLRRRWLVGGIFALAGVVCAIAAVCVFVGRDGRALDPASISIDQEPSISVCEGAASPGGWDGTGSLDSKLMHDAFRGSTAGVQGCLRAGANPNATFRGGLSPLHIAANGAYPGRVEIVRLLIEAGADIHARDDEGRTPLRWASGEDTALVLIRAGADVTAKDDKGVRAWPPEPPAED